MKTNANKPRRMRALTVALALTVLGLTVSASIWMSKCDRYKNTSGDPSNCGAWTNVCPGYCKKLTYSATCGMCVYTGDPLDTCNDVTSYYITESEWRIVCLPSDIYVPTPYCYCPSDNDPSWYLYATQRKLCNCN